ncbi:MAG: hypothetical protein WDO18_10830 [Acidobacteriota bacterium]
MATAVAAQGARPEPNLRPESEVRYELSFPNAIHHEAEVRATFAGIQDATARKSS